MWESKNWVVPHFNYVGYLEKPILSPFITALFFGLLGEDSLAARLPSILSALGGIAITFYAVRRLFDLRAAGYAVMVLATSVGYVLVGRFAVIDMQLLFLMSSSIFLLMSGCFEGRRRDYLVSYIFMGLAFLTKGLIAMMLPGLVFLAFIAWTGRWKEIPKLSMGWGILIVLAVIGPWLLAVSIYEPEFLQVFIIDQHFRRFSTGTFGRIRPFWFFTYILPIICFPWVLFAPSAIVHGLKAGNPHRDKIKFLICWMTVIFVFFSIPKSKLPYYIVPLCVPMAILIGSYLSAWASREVSLSGEKIVRGIFTALPLLCLTGFVVLNVMLFFLHEPEFQELRDVIRVATVLLVAGSGASYLLFRRDRRQLAALAVAGMVYAALVAIIWGMMVLSPMQSSHEEAMILKPRLKADDVVAIYSSPDRFSDFPFHLARRVVVVGTDRGTLNRESLEDAKEINAEAWFLRVDQFVVLFRDSGRRVYCLLEDERLQELKNAGAGDFRILKQSDGVTLISNEK